MMRGRGLLSVLLIVALLATGAMRSFVQDRHDAIVPRTRSASRLSGLNSFTLGLLLGGLRGPLVMLLWSSSENQKMSKNLEDIDTKIDLIRMLQPEFDSVHIFQIWNKAYNLSVMMANLQNKYSTILDALDYARKVDAERPDNVNILASLAEVYLNKLGNPVAPWTEKRYYVHRVRSETLPKSNAQKQQDQPGWRRTQHETVLDANGLILPAFLEPRSGLGALAAGGYTGAELQFLARYSTPEMGGFPHGLPPIALAYNYYKRAAILQSLTHRKHVYLSESVIDSRAAVVLRMWAENEWQEARRLEAQALGQPLSDEKLTMELVAASARLKANFVDQSDTTRKQVQEAIFGYRRAVEVAHHAELEYRRHIEDAGKKTGADVYIYFSHIAECVAMASYLAGDRDYLTVMAANAGLLATPLSNDQLNALRQSAAQAYRKAIDQYYLIMLKYYTEDDVAAAVYKQGTQAYGKNTIQQADPTLYPKFHAAASAFLTEHNRPREYREDIEEYETYIRRASQRLAELQQ